MKDDLSEILSQRKVKFRYPGEKGGKPDEVRKKGR